MAGFLPQVFHWTSFKGEQNTRLQKNEYMKAQDERFILFLLFSNISFLVEQGRRAEDNASKAGTNQ